MPDRDQQPGPLGVGQQHGRVLAGAQRREDHRGQAQRGDPLHPRGPAVVVGVHHQLGPAAQRLVGAGVHVADDHVRSVARLDQRVRAAVHAHQQWTVLADVGPQGIQVAAVVVAADHDQHVPALDLGARRRGRRRPPAAAPSPPGGRSSCCRRTPRSGPTGPPGRTAAARRGSRWCRACPRRPPSPWWSSSRPPSSVSRSPSCTAVKICVTDVVDQRDAGVHQDAGSQVRVAARDRRDGVDHRRHPGLDQRLGADPVQVGVVDDGDLPGPQSLGEVLGAAVEPHLATDLGGRTSSSQQRRESHRG